MPADPIALLAFRLALSLALSGASAAMGQAPSAKPVAKNASPPRGVEDDGLLTKVVKLKPEELDALLNRLNRLAGTVYPKEREFAELAEICDRLERALPGDPRWPYWLGIRADMMKDLAGSRARFEEAMVRVDRRKLPADQPTMIEAALRLAQYRLQDRDAEGAQTLVDRVLAADPAQLRAWELAGDITLRTGRTAELISGLADADRRFGDKAPELTSALFDLLLRVGDVERVKAEVKARTDNPKLAGEMFHYRGLLAAADGDEHRAFLLHYLAFQTGSGDRPTTRKSREWCERMLQRSDGAVPARLRPYVMAFLHAGRAEGMKPALAELAKIDPKDRDERVVKGTLAGTALAAGNQIVEARREWEAILTELPQYPPALVGAGECVEALGDVAAAEALFTKARAVAPGNPRVRQLDRLGVTIKTHAEGVELVTVEPGSPFDRFGVKPGDVITRLDEEYLREQPVMERLRNVRLWLGGRVHWVPAGGAEKNGDMELIYFKW